MLGIGMGEKRNKEAESKAEMYGTANRSGDEDSSPNKKNRE